MRFKRTSQARDGNRHPAARGGKATDAANATRDRIGYPPQVVMVPEAEGASS
jgi:hypothetical protein